MTSGVEESSDKGERERSETKRRKRYIEVKGSQSVRVW